MDNDELRTSITGALEEAVRLARVGQQVLDLGSDITHLLKGLSDLYEREPDLGPEILAAMKALGECSEALDRALAANSALMAARRNRLFPADKGGPS